MKSNVQVIIVEDQSVIAETISSVLKRNNIDVLGVCQSGEDAIQLAAAKKPNLVLMDIHLQGALDGIAAAKLINDTAEVPIIYLSDHADSRTVTRAKQTFPASYLTKPFNEADLIRAIDIAITNANRDGRKHHAGQKDIFVRTKSQLIRLRLDEVLYLEAERSYCKIVTESGSEILSTSMNHVQEQLPDGEFIRVHRSFTVNVKKISAIDGNTLKLGAKEVTMSKDYREHLMSRINVLK
jgi:DNA-binding LytR/AlgR family response regulator